MVSFGCIEHVIALVIHDWFTVAAQTTWPKLFKELDKTIISKVKIGHGEFIQIKVKVNQVVDILTSLKYISDAL